MSETGVEIIANGEPRRVPEGSTLSGFLTSLEIPDARVAVEHNGRVVSKDSFASVILSGGDRLEIVTLVGGG